MSASDDEVGTPRQLWEVGYEYLSDSMRDDRTYADRAALAQTAALFFTAAQSRALVVLAEVAEGGGS